MADLPRLLEDEGLSPLARAVLRSADGDGPSAESRAAMARGLGIAAGVGIGVGAGGSTVAAAGAATAGGAAVGSAAVAWWSAPLAVVALAGVVAVGFVSGQALPTRQQLRAAGVETAAVRAPDSAAARPPHAVGPALAAPPVTAAPVATAPATAAATIAVAPTAAAPTIAAATAAAPRRDAAGAPRLAAAAGSRNPSAAPDTTPAADPDIMPSAEPDVDPAAPAVIDARRLAAEVALLDRARAALQRSDTAAALALLAEHGRDFSDGALGIEAEALHIDALLKRGDRDAAAAAGARFLARYPRSPLARRVRSLLDAHAPAQSAPGAVAP